MMTDHQILLASAAPGWAWLTILGAYLIGSLPFGLIIGRLAKGIDIREHGSGNIGATNVLRIVGKPWGVLVFVLDFLKGLLPVLGARGLFPENSLLLCLVAIATILGHNYTIFLGFKGGKGIATSAGAILALVPWAVLVGLIAWFILFKTTRYVAVASIGSAIAIPATVIISSILAKSFDWPVMVFSIVIAILAIWRHQSNIVRLREGTEHRFEKKSGKKEKAA